jgi:hypothetical protein
MKSSMRSCQVTNSFHSCLHHARGVALKALRHSIGAIAQAVGRIPCSAEKGFAQFVDRFVNVAGEGGSRKALGSLL